MADWDQNEHGLIINVVTGYQTSLLAEAGLLLRIEYLRKQDPDGARPQAVQFGMTVRQARELARDLSELADKAVQRPPGTVPS